MFIFLCGFSSLDMDMNSVLTLFQVRWNKFIFVYYISCLKKYCLALLKCREHAQKMKRSVLRNSYVE